MKHTSIFILFIFISMISYCQIGSNQYSVGNFIITVVTKNTIQPQITVANKAEPRRLLWQTVPGVALIGAATGKDAIRIHGVPMGSFAVTDTIIQRYDQQSITGITNELNQLVINGVLSGQSSKVNYKLCFKLASANQLQYILTTEGSGSKDVNRLFLRFASPADEHFYGFGEQLTFFDQKGKVIPILVQEHGIGRGLPLFTRLVDSLYDGGGGNPYVTGIPAPHYITSKLNSLFLENKQYSVFDLHDKDRVEIKLFSDTLTGRIIYGKTPLDLIREYTSYSGRMRALPDWVNNGAIVCVQQGTDTLKARVAQMDSAGVPLAALWVQDWTGGHPTKNGYQIWWNWALSTSEYPGFKEYVQQLRQRNVRTMIYISPFLGNSPGHDSLFLIAEKKDYLVKTVADTPYLISNGAFSAGLIDLSNPEARDWYESIIHTNLIEATGAAGWMADFGEALPFDAKLHNNAPTSYWHNHFTEEWAALNRKAIKDVNRDSDIVFFNRSGFAQSPANSTLFWLGDQMQTWDQYDGIKTAVVGMLSGGMSGFSLMHSDNGGYNAFTDTVLGHAFTIARSKELLMRWEELNIFNAVYRSHEGLNPRISAQPYTDNETMAHFARSAKMFTALSFYRRQLVKEAADSGFPIVRHPYIQFPYDPNTYSLRYQFMYGSEFMVAPVLTAGATSVRLYLPKGNWINLWTGKMLAQNVGSWITADAPMGKPAVFYQKGSKVGEQYVNALKAANVYNALQEPLTKDTAVTYFTLVNAFADQDIQVLEDGDVLDLTQLPRTGLNIRANTNPTKVGSVVFELIGQQSRRHIENGVPYALFRNLHGDYFGGDMQPGEYMLTATPFSKADGKGVKGKPLTIFFKILYPAAVTNFTLVNAQTGKDIQELKEGDVLNLAALSTTRLSFRAATMPDTVGSVVLELNGQQTHSQTENLLPYSLYGDNIKTYNPWVFKTGSYTLTATPYSAPGKGGAKGTAYTIHFTVTNRVMSVTSASKPRLGMIEVDDKKTQASLSAAPNPFSSQSIVRFSVPTTGYATLSMYGQGGVEVSRLFEGRAEGRKQYQINFQSKALPAGIYTLWLTGGTYASAFKVVLVR